MNRRSIELMKKRFVFLEKKYSLEFLKGECPGIFDIVLITYAKDGIDFICIEKERGFYDFIVIANGERINYPIICRELNITKYSYDDYYGNKGLIKLANEIDEYFPRILKKYSEFRGDS